MLKTALQFAALGFGAGAAYVLLAQGVVLIYRGSGILNFAQGAMAMIGAFVFWDARENNEWPVVPALLLAVALSALIGLVVFQAVMRPLRKASPLARIIATLGVLITLQAFAVFKWGSAPKHPKEIFRIHNYTVWGVRLAEDRLITLTIAILITAGLWALFKFTRVGLATAAVAENERAAATVGWSPNLLASLNWAAGGALAGLAGVLVSPQIGLDVNTLTLLVIFGLTAALLAGFHSFPITLAAGISLGIIGSLFARYEVSWTKFFHVSSMQGLSNAVPFIVIVAFMVFKGRGLPVRGHILERLPAVGSGRVRWQVVLAVVAVTIYLINIASVDLQDMFIVTFSVGLVMLSVVVLTGYTGQVSLAQYALGGLGALIAGRLMAAAGWPFELAVLAGVAGAVPIGLVFALPALRTRGVNLAVVTLGLGMATESVIFRNANYTGGLSGTVVEPPSVFGISLNPVTHPHRYGIFVLVLFTLCCLMVANVRRSRIGRRLLAVRANERAAAALGVSVFEAKLFAFSLSSVIAALGGIAIAFRTTTIVFSEFSPMQSILAVGYTVVGGIGFVTGPLLGSQLVPGGLGAWISTHWLSSIEDKLQLIGGLFLILILIQSPSGMVHANLHMVHQLREKLAGRRDAKRRSRTADALPDVRSHRVEPGELVVSGATVRFGGVVALDDVSLTVGPGQVVGLIGPNGAGKTTLIDAVTGFSPMSGEVHYNGKSITSMPVHRRGRIGITRSFQAVELFEDLTVLENLKAASDRRDVKGYLSCLLRPGEQALPPAAVAAVRAFGLEATLDLEPTELSYGQRRLVGIARAVATEPSVLLLDEPAAGLDSVESAELATLVRRLADDWGIAILLVEHDMNFVMSICDRVNVIDFGHKIAEGTPEEVQADPAVIAAYLGVEEAADAADGTQQEPEPSLITGGVER